MKNRLLPLWDRLLLRRRSLIETIFDQLRNISQIEHACHRSPVNFLINLLAGLIAYCHQPKKPSLCLEPGIPAISSPKLTFFYAILAFDRTDLRVLSWRKDVVVFH